jgi:hypothetical protein
MQICKKPCTAACNYGLGHMGNRYYHSAVVVKVENQDFDGKRLYAGRDLANTHKETTSPFMIAKNAQAACAPTSD